MQSSNQDINPETGGGRTFKIQLWSCFNLWLKLFPNIEPWTWCSPRLNLKSSERRNGEGNGMGNSCSFSKFLGYAIPQIVLLYFFEVAWVPMSSHVAVFRPSSCSPTSIKMQNKQKVIKDSSPVPWKYNQNCIAASSTQANLKGQHQKMFRAMPSEHYTMLRYTWQIYWQNFITKAKCDLTSPLRCGWPLWFRCCRPPKGSSDHKRTQCATSQCYNLSHNLNPDLLRATQSHKGMHTSLKEKVCGLEAW